ncbi:MAG: oligosaccharide flippase family protein [Pirellulales bacterium]|nr:oligosaccharide flippase family protein [Pirellulales bacterium]
MMPFETPAPTSDAPRRFAHRVLDAAAWISGSRMVGLSVQATIIVALARLLTPAEFGSYAVAMALTTFAALVGQLGLAPAIVRAPAIARGQVAGAFWLLVLTGVLCVASLHIIAWLGFKGESASIVRWCACGVLLQNLATVPIAELQRALRFRDYVVTELVAQIVGSGLVSIVAACLGWGVWSLVLGGLVRETIIALGSLALARTACLSRIDFAGTASLARFGVALLCVRLGATIAQTGPQLVVGRVLGAQALGLFTRAFFTVHRLELAAVSGLQNLLLAAFSSGGPSDARLRAGLLRSTRLLTAIVLPLFAMLAVAADDLVSVVLGPQWREAAPLIAIACVLGASSALATVADAVLKSAGKWRILVGLQSTSAMGVVGAAWLGTKWGTTGSVLAVTASGAGANLCLVGITLVIFGVRVRDYLRVLAPSVAFSVALVAAHECLASVIPGSLDHAVLRLAIFTALGGVVALGGFTWLRKHYAGRVAGDYGLLAEWYRGHRRRMTGN